MSQTKLKQSVYVSAVMIMPATGAMLATYLPGPDYFCRILNEWCIFWKYTFPLRGGGGILADSFWEQDEKGEKK